MILSLFSQCEKNLSSEELLLNHFKHELNLVTQYQNDYIQYMVYQVQHFEQKQKKLSHLISIINKHYGKLSKDKQIQYQQKWQTKFQPVTDKIFQGTRQMILNQKAELTPKKEAKIQELSITMSLKEKTVPLDKLKPKFMSLPDDPKAAQ